MNLTTTFDIALKNLDSAVRRADADFVLINRSDDEPVALEVAELRRIQWCAWVEYVANEAGLEVEEAAELLTKARFSYCD